MHTFLFGYSYIQCYEMSMEQVSSFHPLLYVKAVVPLAAVPVLSLKGSKTILKNELRKQQAQTFLYCGEQLTLHYITEIWDAFYNILSKCKCPLIENFTTLMNSFRLWWRLYHTCPCEWADTLETITYQTKSINIDLSFFSYSWNYCQSRAFTEDSTTLSI